MAERSTSTIDLYQCDVKGCITVGSSHVDPTLDEQCCHHRPLGQATPVRESSRKYFVGLGVNRDRTGYLSVAPKVHDADSPDLHISTLMFRLPIAVIVKQQVQLLNKAIASDYILHYVEPSDSK